MLTTVADYKAREGISVSSKDTEIGLVLAEAEKRVALFCDRILEDSGSDITEYLDGKGDRVLYLQAFPIVSITSVGYLSSVTGGAAVYTDYSQSEYFSITSTGELVRFDALTQSFGDNSGCVYWPEGTGNIKVVYRGGYDSATVPDDITTAIYDLTSLLLHGRDASSDKPTAEQIDALLAERIPHRRRVQL